MIINHNMNAMTAHRNMFKSNSAQGKSMEKLSSGVRINRAADDAAGLAISEKMRSQIRGLVQASRNAQDGISLIQTAEGALSETQAIGHRMRELAIQSANGVYTDEDRALINKEFVQLKNEIDRTARETNFNGNKILDGSLSSREIQVGKFEDKNNGNNGANSIKDKFTADADSLRKLGEGNFEIKVEIETVGTGNGVANIKLDLIDKSYFNGGKEYVMDSIKFLGDTGNTNGRTENIKLGGVDIQLNTVDLKAGTVTLSNPSNKSDDGLLLQIGANQNQFIGVSVENMRSRELGLGGIDVSTAENSQEAIERLDIAIQRVSAQRADLGARQNRLEHTVASAENTAENLQASESRIRDVDMAKEMMNLTKLNVLQQASQSMLAQANQAPQNILTLLK